VFLFYSRYCSPIESRLHRALDVEAPSLLPPPFSCRPPCPQPLPTDRAPPLPTSTTAHRSHLRRTPCSRTLLTPPPLPGFTLVPYPSPFPPTGIGRSRSSTAQLSNRRAPMAQVLAPIVQTTGTITMPYSPSDGYQNAPSQPHHTQQRSSQMPRNQGYNGHSSGTGYRGTSAPIAPYAFSTTPQLRQENRSVSAPHPQALQQAPSHANHTRLGHPSHPSSSSDSTVSTSGSSNRSVANPAHVSKEGDARKQAESLAASISLSTSVPDLSFSVGDAPVKPSPGRYRRGAGRTDSSNSIPTGGTTPTQRSSPATPIAGSSASSQVQVVPNSALPGRQRPGHSRAISADDTSIGQPSGLDAAKRYRRRSFNGLDANGLAANMATMQVGPVSAQSTTTNVSVPDSSRPASSSGRQSSRPASSHSHDRQGSAGSVSSKNSIQSQVSIAYTNA
jgi:hypothetical protein